MKGRGKSSIADEAEHRLPRCFLKSLGITVLLVNLFAVRVYLMGYVEVNSFKWRMTCKTMESYPRNWVHHHNMSDDELFLKASSPVKEDYCPVNKTIAFMFLTVGTLHLAPLWERFFKGYEGLFSIYIHSWPSFRPQYPSSSVFFQRQIPSKVSEWGRINISDAERRLLANALMDITNEHFILLSESCIPLYNFTTIYNYVMNSRYSFMASSDSPDSQGRGRYNINMSPEVNITQWRKGTQWFELNRYLARLVIQDNKYYPKFYEFCVRNCCPDEHYFQTMLYIEVGSMLANRSLTWTDWSRDFGAHPSTFYGSDITEDLLKRIHEDITCEYNDMKASTCFLFARKFDPSALEPLLLMASELFGF